MLAVFVHPAAARVTFIVFADLPGRVKSARDPDNCRIQVAGARICIGRQAFSKFQGCSTFGIDDSEGRVGVVVPRQRV